MKPTRTPTPRKLRPREPISVAPLSVSQETSYVVTGVDRERFLDLLRRHPELPIVDVGKLRVVTIDDFRALLGRLTRTTAPEPIATTHDDDAPTTADEVLRALGRRTA